MIYDPQQDIQRFNIAASGRDKQLPKQQTEIVKSFLDYYHNPRLIPQLAYLEKENGNTRQKRAERRMCHALILCAITLKLDFGSSQIGAWGLDGEFKFASLVDLAKIAGLELRDGEEEDAEIIGVSQRFARAWRDLVKADIVGQIEQIIKVPVERNGFVQEEIRAVNAIKFIHPNIFIQIGAVTKDGLKQIQLYSRQQRNDLLKEAKKTRAYQANKLRKIYKRKPRMSARLKAILESQWQNMLRMYRMLKQRFPGNAPSWYRNKVELAFPS